MRGLQLTARQNPWPGLAVPAAPLDVQSCKLCPSRRCAHKISFTSRQRRGRQTGRRGSWSCRSSRPGKSWRSSGPGLPRRAAAQLLSRLASCHARAFGISSCCSCSKSPSSKPATRPPLATPCTPSPALAQFLASRPRGTGSVGDSVGEGALPEPPRLPRLSRALCGVRDKTEVRSCRLALLAVALLAGTL